MPYKFPVVDFSWLGNLPKVMDEASDRAATKEALADLDPSTAEGLRLGAQKAFRAGNAELGLRLESAARERQALGHRISEDVQARQGMPGLVEALRGLGAPPAPAAEQPAEAPAPDYPWPTPGPGAQGPVPVPSVAQGAPPASMAEAPPVSPSETLLAAAEGQGPAPPALGPQLAQVGGQPPLPPVAPPPGAPAGQPAWLQGAQAPVMPPRPPTAPRPQAAPAQRVSPAAQRIFDIMAALPKNAPPALVRALDARYRAELESGKTPQPTSDQSDFERIQAENVAAGKPRQSFQNYLDQKGIRGDEQKEVHEAYKEIRKDGKAHKDTLLTIASLKRIVEHPQFVSGQGAALYGGAVSTLNTLAQVAEQYGIRVPDIAKFKTAQDAASRAQMAVQLQDTFTALANELTFKRIGSLGNQISDADRRFIEGVFPSLSKTREGNRVLLKYLTALSEEGIKVADDANEYRRKASEAGVRATLPDMDYFMETRREARSQFFDKDKNYTKLGKQFLDEIERLPPEAAPFQQQIPIGGSGAPARAPPAAPMGAPRQAPAPPAPRGLRRWENGRLVEY